MAKKTVPQRGAPAAPIEPTGQDILQRPAAEMLYAEELERLAATTAQEPRPLGWKLSPRAVLAFVLGDAALGITPKFVGRRALLGTGDRLAGNQSRPDAHRRAGHS